MNPFGPFGNMMPYSNFHGMNLDWVIQIAKDFLDQYTHIQETIDTGLTDLQDKYDTLSGLLDAWYNEHSEDIAEELASALQDIADALSSATGDFQTSAEAIAQEVLTSIPADYTDLWACLAPTFSSSDAYVAGDAVLYNDSFYRFTTNHTGAWNSGHVSEITIDEYFRLQGVNTQRIINESSQADLEATGTYADFDTVPKNSILTYYLTDAIPAHCPNSFNKNIRGILITMTSNQVFNSPGTVQLWYDAEDVKTYFRTCWTSNGIWSAWNDNGACQMNLLTPVRKITSEQASINTYKKANQGDYIIIYPAYSTMADTYGDIRQQTINLYGMNNSNEVILLAESITMTNEPFILQADADYADITLTARSAFATAMGENDYLQFSVGIYKEISDFPEILKIINKIPEQYGLLRHYKSINYAICRAHDLSAKAGDILTVHPIYTNAATNQVKVYGMHTIAQSGGYTDLGSVAYGETKEIVCPRNFACIQFWENVAANEDLDTLIMEVDAAVNLKNGIQKDIINCKNKPILNSRTSNIFHRVCCVGDSFTSGHIQAPGDETATGTNELYAYPQFMHQITGNEYINCGVSGATTLSWQSASRGLPKATEAGRVQAYIIGLGINDSGYVEGQRRVALGTTSDIGTDNNTFYAQLSKIIRSLNTISPLAKIFVNTCPMNDAERFYPYNTAIRDIVETYANTYPVFCIDLATTYKNYYNMASLINDISHSHYTALGYEQLAEIYSFILSDYINNHLSAFQDVYKIPFDT